MTWKNNTPENLELAQRILGDIASILAAGQQEYLGKIGQGHGHYGRLIQF